MNEKEEAASTSHVPQPGLRLGASFVLGLLGAWLLPVRGGFIPDVLAGYHGAALLVWLAVAFGLVLLLHREEHVRTPGRLFVFMVLALAIATLGTPPAGKYDLLNLYVAAKMVAIALLLLLAGASSFGLPYKGARSRPWTVYLLRGPALAIASPLVLFASRPRRCSPSSFRSALSRASYLILLYALVSPLVSLGHDYYPRAFWRYLDAADLGLLCLSFSLCAWLGCAVPSC